MTNYAGVSPVDSDTLSRIEVRAVSLTPASVAAATCAEQTFSVPGVLVGDFVDVSPPGITAGVSAAAARVSANGTVAITFINPTAGALVPLAGVYRIQINR